MDEARKVIKENELAKIKLAREMEKTREQENAAVREYQKIEEEKERQRAEEFKRKEERINKIMGKMADTVMKNQREAEKALERAILRQEEERI